jgi:two-component system, LytTR family, sensor kinase
MSGTFTFKKQYLWYEVCFFVFFFLLSGPLSMIEYQFYEGQGNLAAIDKQLVGYLIYGLSDIIPYGLFYLFSVKGLLLERRYVWFALSIPIFLIILNASKVVTYWIVSHLTILPAYIVKQSSEYLSSPVPVHFSIIYVLRDLLALVALGLFIRSVEQQKSIADLMRIQAETELGQLKAQLQPHYFFNTLNSIYALSVKKSPLTSTMIAKHAEVMRYILYESNKDRVRLIEDVQFLEALVSIEQARSGPGKEIRFETQGIDESTFIEPLMMLPFVENAFKHGPGDEMSSGYIFITICRLENELVLEIRNSRVKKSDSAEPSLGIGLGNIRKRLTLLYPDRHDLKIHDNENEFRVFLSLQLSV